jgi:hypothetical protein
MDLRTRNSVTFVGRDDGRLVMLNPSPCYIDDADYRDGFRRADLDELLESLDSRPSRRPSARCHE